VSPRSAAGAEGVRAIMAEALEIRRAIPGRSPTYG
jgi:hypothetical protein